MKKYIKTNNDYFEFINKNKEKYEVLNVKILKNSIKVEYERKSWF